MEKNHERVITYNSVIIVEKRKNRQSVSKPKRNTSYLMLVRMTITFRKIDLAPGTNLNKVLAAWFLSVLMETFYEWVLQTITVLFIEAFPDLGEVNPDVSV